MNLDKDIKLGLFKVIDILKDYLPQVVFAGGWAPLIYYHYLLHDKDRFPLLTQEFDLMVHERIRVVDETIDHLLSAAGLHAEPRDSSPHPAFYFTGEVEGHSVEIEFFTPMVGQGSDRAIKVQSGLQALPLRYADILLSRPTDVVIDDHPLSTKAKLVSIMVPSPAAFIFNKGLTYTRRQREIKKAKDLYYIFDILARCPELRGQILEELSQLKQLNNAYGKWFASFRKIMREAFQEVGSREIGMVCDQKPPQAFESMNDDQFRQYVFGTFAEFIEELEGVD